MKTPEPKFINVYYDNKLIHQVVQLKDESTEAALERVKKDLLVVPRT